MPAAPFTVPEFAVRAMRRRYSIERIVVWGSVALATVAIWAVTGIAVVEALR